MVFAEIKYPQPAADIYLAAPLIKNCKAWNFHCGVKIKNSIVELISTDTHDELVRFDPAAVVLDLVHSHRSFYQHVRFDDAQLRAVADDKAVPGICPTID